MSVTHNRQNPLECTLFCSIFLSVCLSMYLSVCLSMYLSVCRCIYLLIYPCIYISNNLRIYCSIFYLEGSTCLCAFCVDISVLVCLSVSFCLFVRHKFQNCCLYKDALENLWNWQPLIPNSTCYCTQSRVTGSACKWSVSLCGPVNVNVSDVELHL
jgi:hypothetical protein